MATNPHIIKATKRHIAKLQSTLDEINTPQIVMDQVRKEMWWLADDIEETICNGDASCQNK
jgi:hypothetical protein